MRHGLLLLLLLTPAVPNVAAQTGDAVTQARALDKAGNRPGAIQVLRTRLVASPTDDDTREVLGLFLSWEGQYDEARTLLQAVVNRRPTDADALAGLMNVELWSGHPQAAKKLAERGLSLKLHDDRFKQGRERALNGLAAARPWTASAGYSYDWFSDGREGWQETQVSLKRYTAIGTVIASAVRAERFGLADMQYQLDVYPKFRPGTYAYVSVGVAPNKVLFPKTRVGADLYQSIGGGFEVSGGFRRLDFTTTTMIYVGTLSKYVGNWMLTGRMYYVPDRTGQSSKSYHGSFRRYFGSDGTSYIGARYSRGFAREEIISVADFEVLASDTFSAEMNIALGRRVRLAAQGGSSRQERLINTSLRQHSISSSLSFRF